MGEYTIAPPKVENHAPLYEKTSHMEMMACHTSGTLVLQIYIYDAYMQIWIILKV
jgi:hypothetical protein